MPSKPSKSPKATGSGAPSEEFVRVFAELREILEPYRATLKVARDAADHFCLETRRPVPRKVPLMFAAVRTMKNYVSYHLMPVYVTEHRMSPELKRRMQGKACFNFTTIDKPLMKELSALTKEGYDGWKKLDWVD